MTSVESRPCERLCPKCNQWKHHSRFRSFKRRRHGSMSPELSFRPICKSCEQKERNENLNEDRPHGIIERRAASHARKAGVPKEFFWTNMNYRALVPIMRAMMTPEGLCLACGHPFLNERDIQIEHNFPPRHRQDWARLHARNLGLACGSCNRGKSAKDFDVWLDEQEDARLSNQQYRMETDDAGLAVLGGTQLPLFADL